MSIEDRTRWEEKHRRASSLSARGSVLALPRPIHGGALALDLACGQGRHAAALLRAGYEVVAMDVARAAARGAILVQADADAWPFAKESFDLIVQVDFLERRLFPVLASSLKSGGLLLVDTFLDQGRPNAEGPSNPDFLLRRAELKAAFPAFDVERYEETTGQTARASMLARKR
jgi:tellurite methyltransferase